MPENYERGKQFIFNCSVYLEDIIVSETPQATNLSLTITNTKTNGTTRRVLGDRLYQSVREETLFDLDGKFSTTVGRGVIREQNSTPHWFPSTKDMIEKMKDYITSQNEKSGRARLRTIGLTDRLTDFYPEFYFNYGVSQKNRTQSEIWLAGYITHRIHTFLEFTNEFLARIEIEAQDDWITTRLSIKWGRVAATLGGLALFQVVFITVAWYYCRGKCEIMDDVHTFSALFGWSPFLDGSKDGDQKASTKDRIHPGKWVGHGDGYYLKFKEHSE